MDKFKEEIDGDCCIVIRKRIEHILRRIISITELGTSQEYTPHLHLASKPLSFVRGQWLIHGKNFRDRNLDQHSAYDIMHGCWEGIPVWVNQTDQTAIAANPHDKTSLSPSVRMSFAQQRQLCILEFAVSMA
jgi:hypothetical protein